MLPQNPNRIFAVFISFMFVAATAILTRIAFEIKIHDGNYAVVYFGIGVWLECLYFAVHFLLQVTLSSRLRLAWTISRALALLTLLPVALIIAVDAVLIGQYIDFRFRGDHQSQVDTWSFGVLVFLLLVIPAIFMLRHGVGLFFPGRAQQVVGPERGKFVL